MTPLVLLLAVVVGVTLGLLGGGGSILTVPLLVYVAGQDARTAIATSLVVVGTTSLVAAVAHARAGRVAWRTALLFGSAGMAGAYVGGRIGSVVDGTLLLVAFALMMAVTAVAMLRGRSGVAAPDEGGEMHVGRALAEGLVVGLVTGIVGAGGGFLVVPALVLLGGLPMDVAVGTSLVVIAMKSGAGLAGYLDGVELDWTVAGGVTAASVLGSLAGGRLAGRVPQDHLRRLFGWFVAAMSLVVLVQEVDVGAVAAWLGTAAGAAVAAGLVVVVALAVLWRRTLASAPGSDGRSEPAAATSGDPADG